MLSLVFLRPSAILLFSVPALEALPVCFWRRVAVLWALVEHSCMAAVSRGQGGLVFSDQCEGVLVTFYLLPPTRL